MVSAYPPNRARLSEYGETLAGGLAKMGLEVQVLADVDREDLRGAKVSVEKTWLPDRPFSLPRIPFAIIRSRPRAVLFNTHFAVFGKGRLVNFLGFFTIFVTRLLGLVMGFRTMVVLHNFPDAIEIRKFGVPANLVNRLGFLLAERLVLASDAIVVTIDFYRDMIWKRFGKQTFYIPHGAWYTTSVGAELEGRDSILYLGYISPSKDLGLLADVFVRVRTRHPGLKLIMAASPHPNFPEEAYQLKVFEGMEGVELMGYLQEDQFRKVFERSILAILPYASCTGSSGVLHLVSGSGIPIVATNLPELRESLRKGAGMILCDDASGMVGAIESLLSNPKRWMEMSEKSRRFGDSRSWSLVSNEFYRLITAKPTEQRHPT
jgi:glycosyltransferase involved in cell wall biosynthesis